MGVGEGQRLGDAQDQPKGLRSRSQTSHMLLQRFSLHILHAAKHTAVREGASIVHGDDAGMFEARQYLGLSQQSRSEVIFPICEIQNLQSDLPVENGVFRQPDGSHTATG